MVLMISGDIPGFVPFSLTPFSLLPQPRVIVKAQETSSSVGIRERQRLTSNRVLAVCKLHADPERGGRDTPGAAGAAKGSKQLHSLRRERCDRCRPQPEYPARIPQFGIDFVVCLVTQGRRRGNGRGRNPGNGSVRLLRKRLIRGLRRRSRVRAQQRRRQRRRSPRRRRSGARGRRMQVMLPFLLEPQPLWVGGGFLGRKKGN